MFDVRWQNDENWCAAKDVWDTAAAIQFGRRIASTDDMICECVCVCRTTPV